MDIASLLDPAIAAAIQAAGISTMMALDVNHVIFDVSGLPNGLSSTCDQGNCQYSSGIDGCILISGTPLQGGNFQVPVAFFPPLYTVGRILPRPKHRKEIANMFESWKYSSDNSARGGEGGKYLAISFRPFRARG